MKFLDLFSGIGGFRLGMEQAGHTCVGHCEIDKFANKSYIAMHKPKEGEWYADDITRVRAENIPRADCWCFGFPCQDISVAGKQQGFRGHRSSLFFTVTGLIRGQKEENKPSYLFIENVKNLLSVNRGVDFARLLMELDEIGYDAEWAVINSADVVPQNRERVFIIGHLRERSTRKVFPIGADSEKADKLQRQCINTITTRTGANNSVGCYPLVKSEQHEKIKCLNAKKIDGKQFPQQDRVYDTNGRRFKTDGEPMFTLISQDRHGVLLIKEATLKGYAEAHVGDSINLTAAGSKTRRGRVGKGRANTLDTQCNQATIDPGAFQLRKLTPRECFRLQGFPDDYFDRAREVCSDTQLYKQAGNGVTVPVIYEIAKKMEVLS